MTPRGSPSGYRFRDDVAWREVGGVFHILTADNRYHRVQDEVGSLILSCVVAGMSQEAIVREVEDRFDVGGADVARDVRAFLTELQRKRVLARIRLETGVVS